MSMLEELKRVKVDSVLGLTKTDDGCREVRCGNAVWMYFTEDGRLSYVLERGKVQFADVWFDGEARVENGVVVFSKEKDT